MLNETADARRRLVLRVALTGACTLDEIRRIEQRLEAVAGNVFALETDLGGLSAVTSADALAAFDDRRLSRIAARLAEASTTDGTGAASGALRLLHRMAAIERQGPAAGSERTS